MLYAMRRGLLIHVRSLRMKTSATPVTGARLVKLKRVKDGEGTIKFGVRLAGPDHVSVGMGETLLLNMTKFDYILWNHVEFDVAVGEEWSSSEESAGVAE
jgi:hypothetical protein